MKRNILLSFIAILTNCIVTSATVPVINTSAPIKESGWCGDTILWVLTEKAPDKFELIIAGTGIIEKDGDFPGYAQTVIIKNGITGIGENAFINHHMSNVTIPNSVTSIGEGAFGDCRHLISIIIPKSVTEIFAGAFFGCPELKSIKVAEGNPIYDSRNNCNAIIETASNKIVVGTSKTIIPNSVTSIGRGAFYGCYLMKSITIPNSVTNIEDAAFGECGLESIIIPNSITDIKTGTFSRCTELTSVIIPNSVTSIGAGAFSHCPLTTITIPNSVTSIGDEAFYDCNVLTSITLPNSVTSIGNQAFQRCFSLTSVTIPNSVTSIGDWAFCECEKLKSIIIPYSVVSIGRDAFKYCSQLSITLPYWFSESVDTKDCKHVTFYHPDDDDLWNLAKNENSEESYKRYLRYTETKKYCDEANKALNRIYSDPEWIEANMWKNVINSNNSEEYLSYLSKYPQGKYADDAKKQLWDNDEYKCWDDVLKRDDVELFDIYLKVYPEGTYKNLAEERKENLLWEMAVTKNTVESYENYLQLSQAGNFRNQAEENIENIIWGQAEKKNTLESYDYYLKKYPQGRFVAKAEKQRDIVEDKMLWKQTIGDASLSAYRHYAETSGSHVNEAKKIIADMEANGVSYNYVVHVGPKGQAVFYETFLQYPCGNKALSWKFNFGKLKNIAQKEGMLNSNKDNDKDGFLCNTDYRHISVRQYSKIKRIEISGSCDKVFGVSKLTVLVERLAKIGVLWENNNNPDSYGRYKGIYKCEDMNVNIELSEDRFIIYVLKK